jgi:hypothetical protein
MENYKLKFMPHSFMAFYFIRSVLHVGKSNINFSFTHWHALLGSIDDKWNFIIFYTKNLLCRISEVKWMKWIYTTNENVHFRLKNNYEIWFSSRKEHWTLSIKIRKTQRIFIISKHSNMSSNYFGIVNDEILITLSAFCARIDLSRLRSFDVFMSFTCSHCSPWKNGKNDNSNFILYPEYSKYFSNHRHHHIVLSSWKVMIEWTNL